MHVFLLIFYCNLFSPRAAKWRENHQTLWFRGTFCRSKTDLNDQVGGVQTLQLRGQDSAIQTYTVCPVSWSPQPGLGHHKYPVSFLWSMFQKKYNFRCHVLIWTFPDPGCSREGLSPACYRSKSGIPLKSYQREYLDTFRTCNGKYKQGGTDEEETS